MEFHDYLEATKSAYSKFDPKKIARLIFDAANETDHEEYEYYMDDMMDAIHREIGKLVKESHTQEHIMRKDGIRYR